MKLTEEQCLDILLNDDDYLDITKWTKKHYIAQDWYLQYCGFGYFERRSYLQEIKKAVKFLKKVQKNEKRNISET
jgi:hypothetical protein